MRDNQVTIPEGWIEIIGLGKKLKVYNGLSGKTKEDFGVGEPYIPYTNIFNNSKVDPDQLDYVNVKKGEHQNHLEYGDIIFTTSSETIDEVGMTSVFLEKSGKYYLNSFCFILRPYNFDWLAPEFAQYLFRAESIRYSITLFGQGSTRYNLSKTRLLKELAITLPADLNEQTIIASILSKVDEAISTTEQLIAKFSRIKTGLMQDLLTKGIDEQGNIRSEETHEFKDSSLGRIPKEWGCETLNFGLNYISDYRGKTPPYQDNGIPVISAESIKDGELKSTSKYVSDITYEIWLTRGIPKPGDVIFTTEAPVGEIAKFPQKGRHLLTRRVIAFNCNPDKLINQFLYYVLLDFNRRGIWNKYMIGSTVPRILKPDIMSQDITYPNPDEQLRVIEIIETQREQIEIEKIKLSKLKSQKKGLMQDLLSGKVRVNHLIKETAKL